MSVASRSDASAGRMMAVPPETRRGRNPAMKPTTPDSLPTAVPGAAPWWKEFFRPVPVPRGAAALSAEAATPPDTEPVVAICRFRSP